MSKVTPLTNKYRMGNYAIAVVFVVTMVLAFYASSQVPTQQIESFTKAIGWFGPLAVVFLLVVTQVFAPLSGTPIMIVGIRLYGYPGAMGLLYCSFLVSAAINFWLARLYGRKLVRKFVGESTLEKIDELARISEQKLLIASRILGFSFFDFVSYAVGLTKINFKKYFVYTTVFTPIPLASYYVLFSRIDFNSVEGLLLYVGSILIIGAVCARIFFKAAKRSRRQSQITAAPTDTKETEDIDY